MPWNRISKWLTWVVFSLAEAAVRIGQINQRNKWEGWDECKGAKKTSSVVSAQFVSVWLLHAQKHSYSYSLHFSQKSASKCCLYSVSNSSSQQTCWKSKDSRNSALLRKILIQLNLAAQISYITCELEDSLIIWEHWFVLLKTLNKSGNFP